MAIFDACNGTLLGANDDSGLQLHGKVKLDCSELQLNTEYLILVDSKEVGGIVPTGYATIQVNVNSGEEDCIWGCTNPISYNYDVNATSDDGTCTYINSCPGDMNDDGYINVSDLTPFLGNFGNSCNAVNSCDCKGDFDADGFITISDFSGFLAVFGTVCN